MKTITFAKIILTSILILVCVPAVTRSQPAPIPFQMKAYPLNSGIHDGGRWPEGRTISAFRRAVQVSDVPWLRLFFKNCNLGDRSYLKITSLKDGEQQHLNSVNLQQWKNTSAFFNGDAVEIELFVDAEDKGIFFEIEEVMVGERVGNLSELNATTGDPCTGWCGICSGIDDRVASNDPAIGRITPGSGCTGWIASNGAHITAGHCVTSFINNGVNDVLEFNVPASGDSGTINHPPVEDQYPINENPGSIQYVDDGVGHDWAVFGCNPNSETGLLPVQAQNAFYRLTIDLTRLTAPTLRVTGYGLDECPPGTGVLTQRNSDSQTQQTSTGPNNGESGSGNRVSWSFSVDLRNGNSGGPIIPDGTGLSIGIVTHCPCPNSGTSFKTDDLENAVNTFPGTNIAYADNGHPFATGQGTVFRPYDTMAGAVNAVPAAGIVSIVRGSYNESMTINKALTLTAPVGSVTIGPSASPKIAAESTKSDENNFANNATPTEFGLSQNYPNPFNPETTIEYTLPKPSFVEFKIYNMLGQEVRTLVNEFQQPGVKLVDWDGKNDRGQTVPSGIYVYRIVADEFRQSSKLV